MKDRWAQRVVFLVVDVVSKHATSDNASSSRRYASGVTTGEGSGIPDNNAEGTDVTCSSPPPSVPPDIPELVN